MRAHDTQGPFDNLGLGVVVAADVVEPAMVQRLVIDPVERTGDAAQEGHRNLRAKARRQVNGVLHRIAAAATECQHAQLGIDFFEVGHRWHDAVFEDFDRNHIFDTHTHRMPGEALGVGHHDLAGGVPEGVAQGHDFGRGAATAGRGVGFV